MFRPIRIRAGSTGSYPYNTPLLFANDTPYLVLFQISCACLASYHGFLYGSA